MAIIVQDSFTDVNGTPLASHTPEQGGAWTGDGIIISGNKATNVPGMTHINNISMPNNQYVKAEFYAQETNYNSVACSLIFRALDSLNYYEFLIQKVNATAVFAYPYKVVNGGRTLLAAAVGLDVTPSWVPVKAEVIGSAINLYVNNILVNTINDSTFSSGKVGLHQEYPSSSYATGITYIDNFEAGSIITPPSAPTNLTLACGI